MGKYLRVGFGGGQSTATKKAENGAGGERHQSNRKKKKPFPSNGFEKERQKRGKREDGSSKRPDTAKTRRAVQKPVHALAQREKGENTKGGTRKGAPGNSLNEKINILGWKDRVQKNEKRDKKTPG